MKSMFYIYEFVKNSYETFSKNLMNKKEELFQNKNFSKWELDNNFNEKELTFIQNDKEKAFEIMCADETNYEIWKTSCCTLY